MITIKLLLSGRMKIMILILTMLAAFNVLVTVSFSDMLQVWRSYIMQVKPGPKRNRHGTSLNPKP